MDDSAWTPLGDALVDYLDGETEARVRLLVEENEDWLTAADLFRAGGLPPAEAVALDLAAGRVLDAGAGAGTHALELSRRGHEVVALDLCARCVEVMRRRGVADARRGDIFKLPASERFDTLLFLMNGLGLAGDLDGLHRLLDRLRRHLAPGGVLLADGCDLRHTSDLAERQRIATCRRQGHYFGEVTYLQEYRGRRGAPYRWLFVDARTLRRIATPLGWRCQIVFEDASADYLARLTLPAGQPAG